MGVSLEKPCRLIKPAAFPRSTTLQLTAASLRSRQRGEGGGSTRRPAGRACCSCAFTQHTHRQLCAPARVGVSIVFFFHTPTTGYMSYIFEGGGKNIYTRDDIYLSRRTFFIIFLRRSLVLSSFFVFFLFTHATLSLFLSLSLSS